MVRKNKKSAANETVVEVAPIWIHLSFKTNNIALMVRCPLISLTLKCGNSRLVCSKALASIEALPIRPILEPISSHFALVPFASKQAFRTLASHRSDLLVHDRHDDTARPQEGSQAESEVSNDTSSATPSITPWYLQVDISQPKADPVPKQNWLRMLPENSPPLIQPVLEYISIDLGLDALSVFDLRKLDPPSGLGANLLMVLATARSEKHLHVSADRFCRWLRSTHKLSPYADGLMGRGELKLKLRRKARRAKLLSSVGSSEKINIDDGLRTGWICVNVGTIESEKGALDLPEEPRGFVGFGGQTRGARLVVQMMTGEKREELDLEDLWSNMLARQEKRDARLSKPLAQSQTSEEVCGNSLETKPTFPDGVFFSASRHPAPSIHIRQQNRKLHTVWRRGHSYYEGQEVNHSVDAESSIRGVVVARRRRSLGRSRLMKLRADRINRRSRLIKLPSLRQKTGSTSLPMSVGVLKRLPNSRRRRIINPQRMKVRCLDSFNRFNYSRVRRRMIAKSHIPRYSRKQQELCFPNGKDPTQSEERTDSCSETSSLPPASFPFLLGREAPSSADSSPQEAPPTVPADVPVCLDLDLLLEPRFMESISSIRKIESLSTNSWFHLLKSLVPSLSNTDFMIIESIHVIRKFPFLEKAWLHLQEVLGPSHETKISLLKESILSIGNSDPHSEDQQVRQGTILVYQPRAPVLAESSCLTRKVPSPVLSHLIKKVPTPLIRKLLSPFSSPLVRRVRLLEDSHLITRVSSPVGSHLNRRVPSPVGSHPNRSVPSPVGSHFIRRVPSLVRLTRRVPCTRARNHLAKNSSYISNHDHISLGHIPVLSSKAPTVVKNSSIITKEELNFSRAE